MSDQNAGQAKEDPYPPAVVAWYAVITLAIANAVSFIDRLILSLLVEDIKADLGLTDTQISLLAGFAFAVFYAFMGLPIARLADSKSRKIIITVGVTTWSIMTAICGLAQNFWHIFMARVGVGVGEATLSPSAYSMLADYFPRDKLALPIGVFSAGVTGGAGLSLIAGAAAISWVKGLGTVDIPLLGPLSDWRLVFFVVGSLGLIVMAMMLFVREPKRRDVQGAPESVPLSEVWAHLKSNWKIYTFIFVGYGTTSISAYGILTWTPVFYIRSFGLSPTEVGYLMGPVALVGGVIGAVFGGALADWLERRGDTNAKLRVLMIGCIGIVPAGIIAPLMPNVYLALTVLFFTFFFGTAAAGPTGSFIQIITPNRMRAQFGALYQLSLNLVGLGLGPTAVALFTDYVFRDEMMVRYSISWVAALANVVAVTVVYMGFRHYPKVREKLMRIHEPVPQPA